jgi:hypothetical protein
MPSSCSTYTSGKWTGRNGKFRPSHPTPRYRADAYLWGLCRRGGHGTWLPWSNRVIRQHRPRLGQALVWRATPFPSLTAVCSPNVVRGADRKTRAIEVPRAASIWILVVRRPNPGQDVPAKCPFRGKTGAAATCLHSTDNMYPSARYQWPNCWWRRVAVPNRMEDISESPWGGPVILCEFPRRADDDRTVFWVKYQWLANT